MGCPVKKLEFIVSCSWGQDWSLELPAKGWYKVVVGWEGTVIVLNGFPPGVPVALAGEGPSYELYPGVTPTG